MEREMATYKTGMLDDRIRVGAKRTALAFVCVALAACAASPTAPRSADMDRWEGEPVVTTTSSCAPVGCATRGPAPATP
jgi:hypothetical protein